MGVTSLALPQRIAAPVEQGRLAAVQNADRRERQAEGTRAGGRLGGLGVIVGGKVRPQATDGLVITSTQAGRGSESVVWADYNANGNLAPPTLQSL
jgi:hypothetical protein